MMAMNQDGLKMIS